MRRLTCVITLVCCLWSLCGWSQETESAPTPPAALATNAPGTNTVPAGPAPTAAMQFNQAYRVLVAGDEARDAGRLTDAVRHYVQAMQAYRQLRLAYPEWEIRVTEFRINYCRIQLENLQKQVEGKDLPEDLRRLLTGATTGGLDAAPQPTEAAPAGQGTAPDVVRERVAALREVQAGQLEQARDRLLALMEKAPDDVSVRVLLGVTQTMLGDPVNAGYILEAVVRENPELPGARLALATAYAGQGKTPEAIRELEECLLLDNELPEAHYDLAHLLLLQRPADPVRAAKHYRRAVQLGGKTDLDLEKRLPPEAAP